jgi:acetolactate synthase-1/2/3 large subunit
MQSQIAAIADADTGMGTGGELLADVLIGKGTDTIFGLPGIQLDPFFAALHDRKSRLRVVDTRHEQGAGYMAFGYAEASGRPGVFTVVPGPGMLNAAAAISTAYACETSVLALIGQIATDRIGRGLGELHELPDQSGILSRLVRSHRLVRGTGELVPALDAAFDRLSHHGMGPVALELPPDVLAASAGYNDTKARTMTAITPDQGLVRQAAEWIAASERPMMFVGRGATHASAAIRRIAEMREIPVVAQGRGKGIMDDRDLLALNFKAAAELWIQTDLVIAVGTRMKHALLNWPRPAGQKLIVIDIDHESAPAAQQADLLIRGDAASAADALVSALATFGQVRSRRYDELTRAKRLMHDEFEKHLAPQMNLIRAIRAVLPEDGILVSEYTQIGYVANAVFPSFHPATIITSGYQGTLGFGFPTALGAKVACPDRAVLAVCGDGGFMFAATELATAVKHQIGLVTIVFNDSRFGNVQRIQQQVYGGRVIATDLVNPDFVRFARSFGAHAVRVESERELGQALREGFAQDLPTVIEFVLPELPDPWPLILPSIADGSPAGERT